MSENIREISREAGEICNFYTGKTIFITGAAGFLGTVLLETLLRCFPDISKIYILLRSKKRMLAEERKDSIFNKDIFIKLKTANPDVLKKVTAVSGDTTQAHLGMNENDYNKLIREVSVVFHIAATISFTKPLNFTVHQNVTATSNIVEFCRKLEDLKAFVYTSSVFSSCNQKDIIEEKIYDLPFSPEEIIKLGRNNDDHEMMKLYLMCNPPFPNFYTFSKCVAENLLKEQARDLPACIIRPSIIFTSLRGPLPGYIEESSTILNLAVAVGKGFVHVLNMDTRKGVDIVPADVTANAHIVAAFHQASKSLPSPSVYNCVSGELVANKWGDCIENLVTMMRKYPVPQSYVYPFAICCKNPLLCNSLSLLLHYMPAFIADRLLWISGSSSRLVKMYKVYDKVMKAVNAFVMREWNMKNENFQLLSSGLNAGEQEMFCMDLKDFTFEKIVWTLPKGAAVYRPNGIPYEEKFKWKCLRYFLTFSVVWILLGSSTSIVYLIFKILKLYSVHSMFLKTRRSKVK